MAPGSAAPTPSDGPAGIARRQVTHRDLSISPTLHAGHQGRCTTTEVRHLPGSAHRSAVVSDLIGGVVTQMNFGPKRPGPENFRR